jgi:diguanylate cyclase (GGDEF)-like protein
LNPPSIQTVLTNLISLTNERDVFQLEYLLAQSLYDLIKPLNTSDDKSVVIYRAINVSKKQFNSVIIGDKSDEEILSKELKQTLADCFNSGEFISMQTENDSEMNLYPLKNANNRTVAVIAVAAKINDTQLHETINMILQIHQNFAGLISDNEHDTLTGLLNRKTFETKLNKVLEQMVTSAKRKDDTTNAKFYLALFDIDHFKKINDEYGHLVGDDVLRELSALMKATFRDKDLLFRYGGEEFLGVFECAAEKDILLLLERFMVKVSKNHFSEVKKMTISIGYTEINAYDNSSQIVNRADQALYYAKNKGRNRTCFYENLFENGLLDDSDTDMALELSKA